MLRTGHISPRGMLKKQSERPSLTLRSGFVKPLRGGGRDVIYRYHYARNLSNLCAELTDKENLATMDIALLGTT
ncbi:hypothetical protein DPMN_092160 [Dreissena polymorpha]|uniref:Uncharacterized protein n=1 Tax=Dreissena polymorpha TaxID=45954 RepID=A0A9D4L162_DREPO|nr:hypothetical protein DPMN_092160 [Dreissena polymorpha]